MYCGLWDWEWTSMAKCMYARGLGYFLGNAHPKERKKERKASHPCSPGLFQKKACCHLPSSLRKSCKKESDCSAAALPTSPFKDQRAPDGDWHRGQRQGKSRPLKGWIDAITSTKSWVGGGQERQRLFISVKDPPKAPEGT